MQRCPQLASDRTVRPFRTTLIFCPSGDIFGIRKRKTKFRKFLSGSKFCFDKFMFESLNQRYVLFLPFSHCGPCVSKESLIKPRITNETFVIFPRMICLRSLTPLSLYYQSQKLKALFSGMSVWRRNVWEGDRSNGNSWNNEKGVAQELEMEQE